MTPSHALVRLASVITVGTLLSFVRMALGWFDRNAGDPVMRERINSGSDKFFQQEEQNWGKSEIDSIIHGHYGEV
jgi:hypothetical protein